MSRKKKILSIGYGYEQLYRMCKNEEMSSRVFYGLLELEEKYDIELLSYESKPGFLSLIKNNLKMLKKADVVYMLYFYFSPLILMSILKSIGFYKEKKIVVISHESLNRGESVIGRWIRSLIYKHLDFVFFHSQLNMDESVALGYIRSQCASFFFWGDNLSYVDRTYKMRNGSFFISTGREYRDFNTLLDAFSQTSASLELYTNRISYDNNYEYLIDEQGKRENVLIEFVDNSRETSFRLTQRAAESLCVVIPLKMQCVTYCVGLTSVVEAMALGKPIISSPNPYSPVDIVKEKIGLIAESVDEWTAAIKYIQDHPDEAKKMGKRARNLAEKRYNIQSTARLLDSVLSSL